MLTIFGTSNVYRARFEEARFYLTHVSNVSCQVLKGNSWRLELVSFTNFEETDSLDPRSSGKIKVKKREKKENRV